MSYNTMSHWFGTRYQRAREPTTGELYVACYDQIQHKPYCRLRNMEKNYNFKLDDLPEVKEQIPEVKEQIPEVKEQVPDAKEVEELMSKLSIEPQMKVMQVEPGSIQIIMEPDSGILVKVVLPSNYEVKRYFINYKDALNFATDQQRILESFTDETLIISNTIPDEKNSFLRYQCRPLKHRLIISDQCQQSLV